MNNIENITKELKIRFGENWTESKLEKDADGYKVPNNGEKQFTFEVNGFQSFIQNKNGLLCRDGKWAVAKVEEEPDLWVIQREDDNPIWDEFVNWLDDEGFGFTDEVTEATKFHSMDSSFDSILEFEDYQYLTLEQWRNLVLIPSKIDFSILNTENVFYVESTKNSGYYFKEGSIIKDDILSFKGVRLFDKYKKRFFLKKSSIKTLKVCNKTNSDNFYKYFPELTPSNPGDWGWFWNEDKTNAVIGELSYIGDEGDAKYFLKGSVAFKHFEKIDLDLTAKEIIKER